MRLVDCLMGIDWQTVVVMDGFCEDDKNSFVIPYQWKTMLLLLDLARNEVPRGAFLYVNSAFPS